MNDVSGNAPAAVAGVPRSLEEVRRHLARTLQLGDRAASFRVDTPLLGALPELDSMAVVTVLTGLEEHFGFVIDDDEISADTFETLGTLAAFVDTKLDA